MKMCAPSGSLGSGWRDVWIKRGLCGLERGNEIIAVLKEEIEDPHELLTRFGKERIARMVREGRTPPE